MIVTNPKYTTAKYLHNTILQVPFKHSNCITIALDLQTNIFWLKKHFAVMLIDSTNLRGVKCFRKQNKKIHHHSRYITIYLQSCTNGEH